MIETILISVATTLVVVAVLVVGIARLIRRPAPPTRGVTMDSGHPIKSVVQLADGLTISHAQVCGVDTVTGAAVCVCDREQCPAGYCSRHDVVHDLPVPR